MVGYIVMYGSHGGELNRVYFNSQENMKEAFVNMINESELDDGDKFVIECKQD